VHWYRQARHHGRSRRAIDLYQLRRAPEPHDANGDAPFTRLTNAFSKKIENHAHAVALHFMHYNFSRSHQSLGKRTTPAMAAGIERHPWSLTQIAELLP